ncbi:FadR/GntR family transcriptional regulator [Mycolicibacterium sp.]|uniref:FadR/GntR family transcriptional regulator n=1 Tax=Mycolicibacterium sp. TaxID=2320850 RepID=UPI003D0B98D9
MVTDEMDAFGLGPVETPAASEVVARHLKRAIHLGIFPAGSKLPRERELAEILNVSRSTLREALQQAKGEGYLDILRGPRGGVFVRTFQPTPDERTRWFEARDSDLSAIYEFRVATEGLAARRAATRITEDDLARLEQVTEVMAHTDSVGEFRSADLAFHLIIAKAAESGLVRRAVEDARAALFLPFLAIGLDEMRLRSVAHHRKIIKALRSQDPDKAARTMSQHLSDVADHLT